MRKSNRSLRSLFWLLLPFLCLSLTGDINKRDGFTIASAGGVSPGTANLIAAYDFNDTVSGEGNDDSHSTYDLTERNSPSYVTSDPEHADTTGTADFSQSSLSTVWADEDGDWTIVQRFKWDTTIPDNKSTHYSGAGNDYIRTKTGNVYAGRIGGGTEITITSASSYDDQWTTVIVQHDTSADETTIYFLNENLSATQGSVTGTWNTGTAYIGSSSGDYKIDFTYYFNDILTEEERQFFGNNSSNAIEYSDL